MSSGTPTGPSPSEREALVAQRALAQASVGSARRRWREARVAGRPADHLYRELERFENEAAEVQVLLVLGRAAWQQLCLALVAAWQPGDDDDQLVEAYRRRHAEDMAPALAGALAAVLEDLPPVHEWAADERAAAEEAAAEARWDERRLWAPPER